jgi:pimeloyl-ACP methyl ester carboxylesterase
LTGWRERGKGSFMTHAIFARDRSLRPPAHRLWIEAVSAMTPMPRRVGLAAGRTAPRGDGHPVLLLPAFLRGERHMQPLERFLLERGYAAYGWDLGVNVGPTDRVLVGIERRLDELHARHGRKVSLIGHSLGGSIARELAKRRSEAVRLLIVLTSPIRLPTASPVEPIYRMLSRWHSRSSADRYATLNEPPEVPVTAIYSRSDGILAWQSCLETEGASRESIEVKGPHSTMARNLAAWRIIADRLAQQEGEWAPYGAVAVRKSAG